MFDNNFQIIFALFLTFLFHDLLHKVHKAHIISLSVPCGPWLLLAVHDGSWLLLAAHWVLLAALATPSGPWRVLVLRLRVLLFGAGLAHWT